MKENLEVTLKQMIHIIHRAINSVDKRLLNHGEKVAYIMLNLLKAKGNYNNEDMLKICVISIFHDIGAYKVAERDKLVDIDVKTPFDHAIYGSLFIKYFSPLPNLYNIVLSHHFTCKYFKDKHMDILSKEGMILSFADYIDRVYLSKKELTKDFIRNHAEEYSNEYIELLLEADRKFNFIEKLIDKTYVDELYDFFGTRILTRDEVVSYSKMLAYSIDFRSEATVKHTILVEAVSYQIAKLCGVDEKTLSKIKVAAALHDIGKIAIPVEILEKPGKLTDEEFEIMKSHAIIGYEILSDLNIDDIRDIGTFHHEKLDGAGYPFGLKGNQLTKEMRIVAIGDITSALLGVRSYKEEFSKDRIIKILNNMAKDNKIDLHITNLLIDNYDFIIDEAKKQASDLMAKYLNITTEYKQLLKKFS
ncbi:MAG: HD domain-containing protein [Clostridium beijerinckii]|jgi:putative nucleotidyltransferase with HDIG domain|uniref:HD domain-containing phosphohydrolase n=1 Tax=Candidatus Clostridium helianthi TaxID=3381660 RepID=A0ABW8SAM4_9CLOT|nr:HD domain-containing phosphohydrolase [Clostridium beijerinckii]MCI1580806.1 HD domain-containing protein [Clostridium beijerinckii]MCI1585559.1 HD domain-containing protein [Clostridium beijerinckii]MCI1624129.1 HD domain-containing protein [Clostridium beijerinckii]